MLGFVPPETEGQHGGAPTAPMGLEEDWDVPGGGTHKPRVPPFLDGALQGCSLRRGDGGPFSSPPTPLPLTWHLLWADGNSVSEEAERGPCSRLGRGGGHPAVPPPSACAEGLSCPGPQHSWDELGRSQPIPGGGSQQRKATTLNPPICPPALLPDTFHLCLNPAWLRNPRTSLERQGGPSWGSPSPNPSADPIPASVSPLGV